MSEWISVTERLPDSPGSYLVWAENAAAPFICYYSAGEGGGWAKHYVKMVYGEEGAVTHWQYLPDPPA